MARKAYNNADRNPPKARGTAPKNPAKVSGAAGKSQPKSGKGISNQEHLAPKSRQVKAAKIPNNDPDNRHVEKREGAGGIGSNAFLTTRNVAPQKSYPTTPLRDGSGAKGAKGK